MFHTTILNIFLDFPISAICPVHLIHLGLVKIEVGLQRWELIVVILNTQLCVTKCEAVGSYSIVVRLGE
jgi:hypothetical protein